MGHPYRLGLTLACCQIAAWTLAAAQGASGTWSVHFGHERLPGTASGLASSPGLGLCLAPEGRNLLVDPGFDAPAKDVKQTHQPYSGLSHSTNGWERNGVAGRDMNIEQTRPARSGDTAWRLVDVMEKGEPAVLQRIPFDPAHRGKRFVFTVWARTVEGHNTEAMIALKWRGKTHWRGDTTRPISVGPEWQVYRVEGAMPADADQIGVVIGPCSYTGTGSIVVDDAWLGLARHRRTGAFTSTVHDMGDAASVVWRAQWKGRSPEGARVCLSVRTRPEPEAVWSPWSDAPAGVAEPLQAPPGRYVQYMLAMETESQDRSPHVQSVELRYAASLGFVTGRVLHEHTRTQAAGATVEAGGETCTTGRDGCFLLGLPAGRYMLSAACLHYLPSRAEPVAVVAGRPCVQDTALRPDPNWWTFRREAQRQAFSALSGELEGWKVMWRHDLGRIRQGHVLVADVTGDGVREVLVAASGALAAYDLRGRRLWRVQGWELGYVKGVYDILGDGQKQVVCVSAGWWPYANGAFTVVRGRDGRVLSRVDQWPDAGDIGHGLTHDHLHGSFSALGLDSTVVADLDGDGKLEVAVHPNYHSRVLAYHFHDGLDRVQPMWETPGRFKYDLYIYPILCDDLDRDGRVEIVYHDNDTIKLFHGLDGTKKGEANMGCPGGLFGPMACKDVDGDGRKEVFLIPRRWRRYERNTIACAEWSAQGFAKRWSRDFDDPIRPTHTSSRVLDALLANVDQDKGLELTVQVGDQVRVLDAATGGDKYAFAAVQLQTVEDVNHDGVAEVKVKQAGKTLFLNASDGQLRPRKLAYPGDRGWEDWGTGERLRWRWGKAGEVEIVTQAGQVKARLPAAAYMTVPIAADLDSDGRVEILVRDASGRIRVLAAEAEGVHELPFPDVRCDRRGGLSRGGGITACDLDSDGRRELIFLQRGRLCVADSAGQVLFRSDEADLHCPTVGHFNRDRVKDVAAYCKGRWIAFDWQRKSVIWDAVTPDSNVVAAWDVDRDGLDDLAGKHGPVFLLDGASGRTLWKSFRREMCALGLGTFADLTGDGRQEILITGEYTNTAWHVTGENLWWIGWSSGGNKEHYAAVADVNRDGAKDVGISSNHGVFYCVDGRDGRQLWTFDIGRKVTLTHPAAADLDGDGKPEFVFGTMAGRLIVLNGEDGSVAKTMDFHEPVGPSIVADVDRDGIAEVMFVCDSALHCID